MEQDTILLSSGSFPWLGIKDIISLAKETGFDGIELVPTKKIVKTIKENKNYEMFRLIKSLHHTWKLDIGHDKEFGLPFLSTPFFTLMRLYFFPSINESKKCVSKLSKILNIPVTVHNTSKEWVLDQNREEFKGGILYEIIGRNIKKEDLKKWTKSKNHYFVVDTRDDQSLLWAKRNGFLSFEEFWTWLRTDKIKNVQLTLIGKKGFLGIFSKKNTLVEKELLWLNKHSWQGTVTVEANPITLFLLTKGKVKDGLRQITKFVNETLNKGRLWSNY